MSYDIVLPYERNNGNYNMTLPFFVLNILTLFIFGKPTWKFNITAPFSCLCISINQLYYTDIISVLSL